MQDVNSLFAFFASWNFVLSGCKFDSASVLVNFLLYELRAAKKVGEVGILNEAYVLRFS
jgi:hypothetical protein